MIMTVETNTATDFISKLNALKQERFSGQLLVKDPFDREWIFYLFLGRILYATGGDHPVRRWQRNLTTHCPTINLHQLKSDDTSSSSTATFNISWEYQLLFSGLKQRQITREQAAKIIAAPGNKKRRLIPACSTRVCAVGTCSGGWSVKLRRFPGMVLRGSADSA